MAQAELKKLEPSIKSYVDRAVEDALEERFGDPDAGLELRESFVRRILAREKTKKKKYLTSEQVRKNLRLG